MEQEGVRGAWNFAGDAGSVCLNALHEVEQKVFDKGKGGHKSCIKLFTWYFSLVFNLGGFNHS